MVTSWILIIFRDCLFLLKCILLSIACIQFFHCSTEYISFCLGYRQHIALYLYHLTCSLNHMHASIVDNIFFFLYQFQITDVLFINIFTPYLLLIHKKRIVICIVNRRGSWLLIIPTFLYSYLDKFPFSFSYIVAYCAWFFDCQIVCFLRCHRSVSSRIVLHATKEYSHKYSENQE